jgi:hypothetical protein
VKLTVEQRGLLFTRLVEAMAREGVLAQAVEALPLEVREAFYRAAPSPSAEDARAQIAAMAPEQQERIYAAKRMVWALTPRADAALKDRLDEDGAREYFKLMLNKGRGPADVARDWLRKRAEASLLTPEQVAENRRERLRAAALDYNKHLEALIDLGPLAPSGLEPVTTRNAEGDGSDHLQDRTKDGTWQD